MNCSRCHKPRDGNARYCRECATAYMREWRTRTHRVTFHREVEQRLQQYAGQEGQPVSVIVAEAVRNHVGLG